MSNPRQSTHGSSPKTLTSERIAADIAAFNKAGGRIEVLGNTPFQRKTDAAEVAGAKSPAAASERSQK
jgi:hypothetical protein